MAPSNKDSKTKKKTRSKRKSRTEGKRPFLLWRHIAATNNLTASSPSSSSSSESDHSTPPPPPPPSKRPKKTKQPQQQPTSLPPSDSSLKPQPPLPTTPEAETAFSDFYLQQLTKEFANDLDKLRAAGDFNAQTSVGMLIRGLQQGTRCFAPEERVKVGRKVLELG